MFSRQPRILVPEDSRSHVLKRASRTCPSYSEDSSRPQGFDTPNRRYPILTPSLLLHLYPYSLSLFIFVRKEEWTIFTQKDTLTIGRKDMEQQ